MKEIAIVYMVAGMSSRFGGKIKQFARVTDKETLIEYSLNQAINAGFNKIIFIVGKLTNLPFREKFGNSYKGIPIRYAEQDFDSACRDRPWGTGDAACAALPFIDCPVIVCNGDDIYGENTFRILFNHLQDSEDTATIGYKLIDVLSEKGSVNRGVFMIENSHLKKITETFNITPGNLIELTLSPDILVSQNIFALLPGTLGMLKENLEKFKIENAGDRRIEFLLSNELSNLIEQKKIKMKLYSAPDKWIGVTNPEDEQVVRDYLRNK